MFKKLIALIIIASSVSSALYAMDDSKQKGKNLIGEIHYTGHACKRMKQRSITEQQVKNVLLHGKKATS